MKRQGRIKHLPVAERLLATVEADTNGGCWLWSGSTAGPPHKSYGKLMDRRRSVRAHRASYEAFVGPVGDGWVLHKCDVPLCINPDHLFLGDSILNNKDRDQKGRAAKILDAAMVREIRLSSESSRQLEKRLPVTSSMIRRIRRGEAWTHVGEANEPKGPDQ